MNLYLLALIGILCLFILMFLRIPISFSMFIVGFVGLLIASSEKAAFSIMGTDLWNQFSSYSFSVIPLFIFMGEIIYQTGTAVKLFDSAYRWLGRYPGGMASTTVLASSGFASICGSNTATSATIGTMALPELERYKYDKSLSTGSIAAGGTLGIIIPPSTVLIVIALQTEQSIKNLFIASIIPGALLTILFILIITYMTLRNPALGPIGEKFSLKEKLISLINVIPIVLLFIFVIGGLYVGLFSPTESGAFGAFGALMLSLAYQRLTWHNFKKAIIGTLKTASMVMMLVAGGMVFGRFLTLTRLPHEVAEQVTNMAVPNIVILITILLIFIIGGSIMDALGFLIISIPVFYPAVIALGYDPVWFAVILCIFTSLGAITPPVGVNIFIVQGLTPETSILTIIKGIYPFLIGYIIFIALLIVIPEIVTFLVN